MTIIYMQSVYHLTLQNFAVLNDLHFASMKNNGSDRPFMNTDSPDLHW